MMRQLVSSGSPYEPIMGMSRAVRVGPHIYLTATAAIGPDGKTVGVGDVAAQTKRIFEIVRSALEAAGASLKDVVRTRHFLTNISDWKIVAEVHGAIFADIRPATFFVEVSRFIDPDWLIEIEVDAVVDGAHA